ncbi:MAG: PP2C family protein-serine/threonine phosphatase [Brevefilum sp.]
MNEKTVPLMRKHLQRTQQSDSSNRYRIASCQSTGKERSHNEDSLFTLSSEAFGVAEPIYFGIFLVADGMGGHQSGEVASRLAVQAVSKDLMDHVFESLIYHGKANTRGEINNLMKDAVNQAQALIQQKVPGGGTTLTLAMVINDQFYSAHVGDSRLYLIDRKGQLSLKTKDHSLVKRLMDLGEISAKEAGEHPQRNVLYRALGQEDPLEPDLDHFKLDVHERMLICSDGLWGVLDAIEIETMVKRVQNLDKLTCELVKAANEAGGPDNISVILVERIT